MMVKLELNKTKVKDYNKRIKELKEESPDLFDDVTEVNSLNDRFIPYSEITYGGLIVIEDDYRNDFDGIYVCDLNSNYTIEALTNYKEKKNFNSPLYWWNYGVCDNASQVLDYYDSLYEQYKDYMEDKKFVILLTPMIREQQPECGGWRWHKWGQYIGKFESKCEYLYDEEGIDYVYCFNILEVEDC